MAWHVKEQYVDKALGQHIIHLHEPETKAEHIIQILIGHEACPLCGHVRVKENGHELTPRTIIAEEVAALEQSHAQAHDYATRHGVPVKK